MIKSIHLVMRAWPCLLPTSLFTPSAIQSIAASISAAGCHVGVNLTAGPAICRMLFFFFFIKKKTKSCLPLQINQIFGSCGISFEIFESYVRTVVSASRRCREAHPSTGFELLRFDFGLVVVENYQLSCLRFHIITDRVTSRLRWASLWHLDFPS